MHSTNIAQYPSIGIVSQRRFFVNSNIFQMRPLSIELLIGGGQSWWTGEQAIPPLPHPQFAMVVPLRSQARLWHSLLHWGLRTGLRFAGPVFRGCGALRAVLAPPPLRGFDGYGLFPPLAAAFVRFLNSAWSSRCAHKLACGTPCFIGLTTACFAHCARPSCAPKIFLPLLTNTSRCDIINASQCDTSH